MFKRKIKLSLTNSEYLKSEFQSIYKLAGRRRYRIEKEGDHIKIDRVGKESYDFMGGELYKLCAAAKGKIATDKNQVHLDLKVGLTSFFKGVLITFFLIFGTFTFLAFDVSFKAGRTMAILSLILLLVPYYFLFNGVKNFNNDLKEDLEQLDQI